MADDEAQVLAAAKKLPLEDRVEHKNWKVRSEAYEDVRAGCDRAFSSSDPILNEAGPLLPKCVGDANAAAMDKALDALCAWLAKADESQASRIVGPACSTIAAKCLKARPGTVARATEACLLFVELEQQGAVVEAAIKAFADKVPKVVLAALDVVTRAVSEFGARVVDPKPLFKALPSVYGHSNAGVRDKAKELTVELAGWVGAAAVTGALLEKMSDAMRKDVEGSIAAASGTKKTPSRFTRKEAAARAAAGGAPDAEDDGSDAADGAEPMDVDEDAGGPVEGDPYDFADPVDIMGPLSKSTVTVGDDNVPFWDCFESKKWNVRKGALDKVKEAARTPRLAPGDYGDLCRELRKVLAKDANINCAAAAAEVAGALATGLRRDFSGQARQLAAPIMERFKEKNTVMCRAADEALRAMARYCYALPDVADDIAAALGHKNPKVRLDTLRLLKDMVDGSDRAAAAKTKEPLAAAAAKLAPDADAGIREAAQAALVAYALKLGSFNAIQPLLSKLDDSRAKMIEEAVMAAAKAASAGGKPAGAAKPAPAAAKAAPAAAPPPRSSPKALAPKNANVAAPTRAGAGSAKPAAAARPRTAAPASSAAEDDSAAAAGNRLSPEEAEAKLTDAVGAGVVEGLRSAKWQDRLESATAIAERATTTASEPDAATLLLCLAHLPGWGDKNFQVVNKCLEVAALLARECPGFGKLHAAVTVEGAGDKIHELKHRIPASEALTAASEAVGPRFVAAQLHTRAAANKNPKALSEALAWLAGAVEEFGLPAMDLGALLQWMVADLGSPNAPVRNQAMAVLGRCHAQVGGGLMAQLSESLKPAQVTALEEIFRKNPQDPEFKPSRRVRAGRPAAARGAAAAASGAAPMDAEDAEEAAPASMEDLLPRANIAGQLTPALVAQIGSSNWKERNAALEEIEGILKAAGGRITPDLPQELFSGLRGRMGDTNRNLAARALLLIGKLAEAVGAPFDRLARPVLAPALGTLSDNKKQVRDAAIAMLDAWAGTCTPDKLFPPVLDVVANPKVSADGRVAALGWMARAMAEGKGAARCGEPAVRAAAVALGDKAAAVRDGGVQLLTETVAALGGDETLRLVGGLDAGARATAEPWALKVVAASGGGGGAAAAAASASAAPSSRPGSAKPPATTPGPASRPGTRNGAAPGTAGPPARPAALSVADQENPPLLSLSSTKAARARQFRPRPGKFEGPPIDEVEVLEAAFTGIASEELRAMLFSRDFRDHVKAAEALETALPDLLPEAISALDLIFRWAVVRVCEGNTQTLVRVLELLRALLEALAGADYRLSDAEAAALLPGVVEKAGHNQDRVRGLHREVLRAACAVYPTARVVDYLAAGLASKNSRTRVEAAEALAAAVDAEGAVVVTASKAKPMLAVAAALKERDSALRSAALGVVEAVWAAEGADALWKSLGRLETREKEMVEDRLRRSARQPGGAAAAGAAGVEPQDNGYSTAPAAAAATPDPYAGGGGGYGGGAANGNGGAYEDEESLPAASMAYSAYTRPAFTPPAALDITPTSERPGAGAALPAVPSPPATFTPPPETSYYPSATAGASSIATPVPQGLPPTPTPQPMHSPAAAAAPAPAPVAAAAPAIAIPATGPDDAAFERRWGEYLAAMASPSLPTAVNATKALCSEIMAVADPAANPPASRRIRVVMGSSAERLFGVVLAQLGALFDAAAEEAAAGAAPSSRGVKFALNTMLQGMSVEEVAGGLPQGTLRQAIALLLCRLVDERGLLMFEEGPTLVRAVNVLIAKMLDCANRNYSFAALLQLLREAPPGVPPAAIPKFNDLLVKCLIKLTKGLQTSMSGVDMAALLLNIHDFFMYLGVDEIRRRSSTDDKPLRMVKTVLHELCKMAGHGIYVHAAGIPGRKADPQPIIFAYIGLNLASLEASGLIAPATGEEQQLAEIKQQEAEMVAAKAAAARAAEVAVAPGLSGRAAAAEPALAAAPAAEVQAAAQKAEVKARLKAIMTRLVQRDPAAQKAAMVELHRLRREHPQYVERYIAGASDMFRQFIDSGLAALDAEVAAGGSVDVPRLAVAGLGGGNPNASPTPGSARSDGSQSRISNLRERLSSIKAEGGAAGVGLSPRDSGVGATPPQAPHPSVEELTARLQSLRRTQ